MIGLFDSGLGGLTIQKALLGKLPQYNYIYLGDSANAPYGNKSQKEIYKHTQKAVIFLFANKCEIVIIACNTASARALRKLQKEWLPKYYPDKKILGVLIPTVEEVACETIDNKKVGLIATKATVKSGKYKIEIAKIDPQIELFSVATPLLVPIIEAGKEKEEETKNILIKYLSSFKKNKIKYLILGCTHYSFLKSEIQEVLGKDVKIIDTAKAVAVKLEKYLNKHKEVSIKLEKNHQRIFYTTGDVKSFKKLGEKFLQQKIAKLKKVKI